MEPLSAGVSIRSTRMARFVGDGNFIGSGKQNTTRIGDGAGVGSPSVSRRKRRRTCHGSHNFPDSLPALVAWMACQRWSVAAKAMLFLVLIFVTACLIGGTALTGILR